MQLKTPENPMHAIQLQSKLQIECLKARILPLKVERRVIVEARLGWAQHLSLKLPSTVSDRLEACRSLRGCMQGPGMLGDNPEVSLGLERREGKERRRGALRVQGGRRGRGGHSGGGGGRPRAIRWWWWGFGVVLG